MDFNHISVEKKWKEYWAKNGTYKVVEDSSKEKFYVLDMFPYPSGAGLHVGHPLGYIASDIFSRYKSLKGFNVLHPMGFDAFGLPAEEYAIQSGIHPAVSTADNMKRYKEQLGNLGFSFDWDRELYTCDPDYYKWTQWIFIQLFEHYYNNALGKAMPITHLIKEFEESGNQKIHAANSCDIEFDANHWNSLSELDKSEILREYRLAYRKVGYVNWCEALGTVLANDQVKEGLSVRGGHPVEQRAMTQWYLRTTAYAHRLLNDLEKLEWSHALKTIQRNWIGKSEGASIYFPTANTESNIEIFTTRPDTIYGATFMVLAPKHDLVDQIVTEEQKEAISKYLDYVSSRSELERISEKKVTGEFTGAYAINPITKQEIPIWISEYVLKDYGTGAIMAVPSDDDRDNAFAQHFNLQIIEVVDKAGAEDESRQSKEGTMINSGILNGLDVKSAIQKMLEHIETEGLGSRQINYKLRDANFSRQRYWGEPFPIKYTSEGVPVALEESELPLELPDTDDFKPGEGGQAPLSRLSNWVNLENGFTRETDVMPAVAGSSWYYLRYMDPHNNEVFAAEDKINYWQDVDLYVGGAEHAVAHLLYARFWHKFLFDINRVPTEEPFQRLINQGMIQGVIEYVYMLKEKENGVSRFLCKMLAEQLDPDSIVKMPVHIDFVNEYGTDQSYLNLKSFEQFINWRPEFKNAIFECSKGIYQNGQFTPKDNADDAHLYTVSEVGKMSKSKFNVINPDEVVEEYGADCFRMYEMFLGPIEQGKPWDTKGIEGVSKFIRRTWNLFHDDNQAFLLSNEEPNSKELKVLHDTINKVSKDIENFSFNTSVSHFMVCVNELRKLECDKRAILEPFLILLAPFAPFITEELWQKAGHDDSIHHQTYPVFKPEYVVDDQINLPVCINGKKRGQIEIAPTISNEQLEEAALALPEIQKWTEGKTIRKVIIVPKRMVNIVVG